MIEQMYGIAAARDYDMLGEEVDEGRMLRGQTRTKKCMAFRSLFRQRPKLESGRFARKYGLRDFHVHSRDHATGVAPVWALAHNRSVMRARPRLKGRG